MVRPVLVALDLDHETYDVLRTAGELSRRLEVPLLPVHVLGHGRSRTAEAAREALDPHLASIASEGTELLEPALLHGRVVDQVLDLAAQHGAQMIVTGGGGPATVGRFLMGSTAEAIVRAAHCPVLVARGVLPFGRPVLCPVDLSAQSRVGLLLALRMARLFDTTLRVLHVVEEERSSKVDAAELERRVEEDEAEALDRLAWFLEPVDTTGVEVERRVSIGPPAQRIVEAAAESGLLVIASRGFTQLKAGALGGVTEKALRFSRESVLTVRDEDPRREEREDQLRRLADLKSRAEAFLKGGEPESALPLLELAHSLAPINAAISEALANALHALGRHEQAKAQREHAADIRARFA